MSQWHLPSEQSPLVVAKPPVDTTKPHHIQPSELKYSISVDSDAWFIRFYLWLWHADVKSITFCKLFWAYVFAVPFGGFLLLSNAGIAVAIGIARVGRIVGRAVAIPAGKVGTGFGHFRTRQQELRTKQRAVKVIHRKEREQERKLARQRKADARLERLEDRGSAFVLRMRSAKERALQTTWRVLLVAGKGAMASARITGLALRGLVIGLLWPMRQVGRGVVGGLRGARYVGHRVINSRAVHSRAATLLMLGVAGCISLGVAGFLTYGAIGVVPEVASLVWSALVAAVLFVPTAITGLGRAIWSVQPLFWTFVGIMALVLLGMLAMTAVTTGLTIWLWRVTETALGPPVERAGDVVGSAMRPVGRAVGRAFMVGGESMVEGTESTVEHIGKGAKGFARALYLGYYGVKTSTCPRIEVKSDD